MSEQEKDSSEKKNLETVDFSNKKERIQTAHSKQALLELGLEENKLYRLDKEKYLLRHPELKNASTEIQDKRYDHYEQRRQDQIELAKKRRNELIEKENEENKENKNKENKNDENNENNENNEEPQSEAIKKELEKLEMMKKQQLGEIKNIIDYAYKMEEFKKKNQEKIKLQEEKEEKLKEEKEKQKKEKEELQKKKKKKKKKKLKKKQKN